MQAVTIDRNTNSDLGKQDRSGYSANLVGGLMAALVTTVIATGFLWMMKPATLPIRQVHIEGEFLRLDTLRLKDLVTDKVRGGFFNIDVAAIRNSLVALPWVNDVSVHRIWPDGLRVIVNEQIAFAKWNKAGLLNEKSQYFSPKKDTFPQGLPFLEGSEGSQELLLERFNLLKKTYGLSVVRLQLDDRRAWKFELKNGLSVVLGRRDFEDRAERFVNVVMNNLGEKLLQASEIDMRYTNGFAVRWKQQVTEHMQSGVN